MRPTVSAMSSETDPIEEVASHEPRDQDDLATATEDSTASNDESKSSNPTLTGYELVADMMRRQDEVISELDTLNLRIEAAIKEISDARKLELEAGFSGNNPLNQETPVESNVKADSTPLRKVA